MAIARFPRLHHLPRELVPHDLFQTARSLEHSIEIDSRVVAHALQHVHHVLGAAVAGRAWREWASAQPAQAAFEARHARAQARHDVGEPHAARVVEVQRQLDAREALPSAPDELLDLARIRHAGGVAERYAAHAEVDITTDAIEHLRFGQAALERTTECGRDRADHTGIAATKRGSHLGEAGERLVHAPTHVGAVVRLRCRHDQYDLVDLRRERALGAA